MDGGNSPEEKHPFPMGSVRVWGTDSGAIHLTRGGVPSGVISIPTRYIHSPSETIDQKDVENALRLLLALLEDSIDI